MWETCARLLHVPQQARRWIRRLLIACITGVLSGCAAALLEYGIHKGSEHLLGHNEHPDQLRILEFDWHILLMPALGALVAGLMVYLFANKQQGHGVDILTRAFHKKQGRMHLRSPLIRNVGAALVISTGGSAGPEGPIAALGAAIGSRVGKLLKLTVHERRILLVAGCAAAIGAIFRCPLGGALFATGILYSEPEFESDAMVPSFVASVLGYSVYMQLWGYTGPMLQGVIDLHFTSPKELIWYAILGPMCGLTAIFFSLCMNTVENRIRVKMNKPVWMTAALGGLCTGGLACLLPQVMDDRYQFVQSVLSSTFFESQTLAHYNPWMWVGFFFVIVIVKCIATGLTVGSGAPGGVLGPSVFIGGMVGALLGAIGLALFPDSFPEELRAALIPVGMAGVLAATMRVPIASMVMVTEMTGSYGLIAPLMIVCVTSYLLGRGWGLNHEQLRSAADSPAHAADPVIHLLESTRVGQIMQPHWPMTISPDLSLDEIIARVQPGTRPIFAVVKEGTLKGIISASDLGHVVGQNFLMTSVIVAEDLMTENVSFLSPDDDLFSSLAVFAREDHVVLPVLERADRTQWVGMLERKSIVDHLHDRLAQTHTQAFSEYEGLSALEADLHVDQLILGVSQQHANIQKLFVPLQVVGQSLKECDFRKQFNAQVIAIEQPDGTLQTPPDLDAPLRTDQRLLTVVWETVDVENQSDPEE
ncbi:chloride channel protein [bacterium AH-315-I18]|nr:chloride channel protein [bacterium AH-315-I18]